MLIITGVNVSIHSSPVISRIHYTGFFMFCLSEKINCKTGMVYYKEYVIVSVQDFHMRNLENLADIKKIIRHL